MLKGGLCGTSVWRRKLVVVDCVCVCVCGSEVRFCKTSRVTTLWLCSGWVQAHNPLGYGEEDKVVWLKNTCSDPHKQLKCSKVCVKHLLVSSWLAHGWILPTSQWKYIMLFLQQTWLEKFLRSPYKHLLLCRENRWRWRNFQGGKIQFWSPQTHSWKSPEVSLKSRQVCRHKLSWRWRDFPWKIFGFGCHKRLGTP